VVSTSRVLPAAVPIRAAALPAQQRLEMVFSSVRIQIQMRREILAKWAKLKEDTTLQVQSTKAWERMLGSVQLHGLLKEEDIAPAKRQLGERFTRRPEFFELFLQFAAVREVQADEVVKGSATYSLEMPKDGWLECSSTLGVLPPEAANEGSGATSTGTSADARRALLGIFISVNKRREEMVRAAKISHHFQGEKDWTAVDMAKDGMSGSANGLSLSEFIEAITFTACDAADGAVDGQAAAVVMAAYKKATGKGGKRDKAEPEPEFLSVAEVVSALDHFYDVWMKPLAPSLRSFRVAVRASSALMSLLAELAPLHARYFQVAAARNKQTGLLRMGQKHFNRLIERKWAGPTMPTIELLDAAYAHGIHIALYASSNTVKRLGPHDFQETLLWLALTMTRGAHEDARSKHAPLPGTDSSMVAEFEVLSGRKRAERLQAIRTCLALGDERSAALPPRKPHTGKPHTGPPAASDLLSA